MGKISKLITVSAIAAATGAGVYYYLNKTKEASEKPADGVSGTGTTAQDSVSDFFREKKEAIVNSREYVSLSKSVSATKDALVKTVTEAAEMIKEKASEAKDGVGVVKEEAKDKACDFEFEEFDGHKDGESEDAVNKEDENNDEA